MNTPPSPTLLQLLASVAAGEQSVEQAAQQILSSSDWQPPCPTPDNDGAHSGVSESSTAMAEIEGATIDLGRAARCGFGEVIYGEGKSTELIQQIVQTQLDAGQDCLITRIESTTAAQLRRSFEFTFHHPLAHTLRVASDADALVDVAFDETQPHVAIVTGGSTDAAVAEEASQTLAWMKVPHLRIDDIGVAGPQRLLAALPQLRKASAIVVIAGMEGALPPTVAGHVAVPVVAVPTSTGYGVNFAGLTPLMGMLTSCAANVSVVNIDAGFKGGYVAGLIADGIRKASK